MGVPVDVLVVGVGEDVAVVELHLLDTGRHQTPHDLLTMLYAGEVGRGFGLLEEEDDEM